MHQQELAERIEEALQRRKWLTEAPTREFMYDLAQQVVFWHINGRTVACPGQAKYLRGGRLYLNRRHYVDLKQVITETASLVGTTFQRILKTRERADIPVLKSKVIDIVRSSIHPSSIVGQHLHRVWFGSRYVDMVVIAEYLIERAGLRWCNAAIPKPELPRGLPRIPDGPPLVVIAQSRFTRCEPPAPAKRTKKVSRKQRLQIRTCVHEELTSAGVVQPRVTSQEYESLHSLLYQVRLAQRQRSTEIRKRWERFLRHYERLGFSARDAKAPAAPHFTGGGARASHLGRA